MSDHKMNYQINGSYVVLIAEDGKNLGLVEKDKAVYRAKSLGLDLMQMSVNDSGNPICKIIDYSKIKYEESKKKNGKN